LTGRDRQLGGPDDKCRGQARRRRTHRQARAGKQNRPPGAGRRMVVVEQTSGADAEPGMLVDAGSHGGRGVVAGGLPV